MIGLSNPKPPNRIWQDLATTRKSTDGFPWDEGAALTAILPPTWKRKSSAEMIRTNGVPLRWSLGFYQDDQERLKITHTGSDGQKREAFLDSPTDTIHKNNPGTHEYTVSVKGCSQCTIRVEIVESAKSKKANTQSFAH